MRKAMDSIIKLIIKFYSCFKVYKRQDRVSKEEPFQEMKKDDYLSIEVEELCK